MALQPIVKPWPPKYIHSIVWHDSPYSGLCFPNKFIPLYGTTGHSQALVSQTHSFHCMALQPLVKPWPPKYIHSIVWHYSPYSSLCFPNTFIPLYGTTAHSQALASQMNSFHCMALQPIVKPWPPKYIHSIVWHYSPYSSLGLPNTFIPLYGTIAHIQALASQIHWFHPMALQPIVNPWPPKYIHSIVWHYNPYSSLCFPNTYIPLYGTTAHSQTMAPQIHSFHCMALQPIIKPWPPKYIHSIVWHYSP